MATGPTAASAAPRASRPASAHLAMTARAMGAPRRASSAPPALARVPSVLRHTVPYSALPHLSESSVNAAPLLRQPRADLGDTEPEDYIPIRVETMSNRRTVTVLVQRSDFEPLASMGAPAVRWAICCALRRTFTVGSKFPLQTATLLVRADGRSAGARAPHSWDSLSRFVQEGGVARLQCRLPGGRDQGLPAGALGDARPSQ